MKVKNLNIDYDIDYDLIAINTNLEDYLLAFNLNRKLNLSLHRLKNDIICETDYGKIEFPTYAFEDETNNLYWTLVQNKRWISVPQTDFSLFDEITQKIYLFSDFNNIDYFIKIEDAEFFDIKKEYIINKIKEITQISFVFWIDINQLKAKNNLIF